MEYVLVKGCMEEYEEIARSRAMGEDKETEERNREVWVKNKEGWMRV